MLLRNSQPPACLRDTQNCTGYGIGCHGGECICQEGRTGRGDFVSGSPACHLDVIAVRVLWGLLIVAHALHLVYALHYLYTRPKRGKKWYRDFPFIAGVAAFISSLSFVPLGLIRVIDPGMTIGTSVAATILFMTASMGFWTVIHIITHIYTSLLTRSLRGRPEAERNRIAPLVSRFSRAIPIGWITSMLACLSVVFTLINPNDPWIMFGFAAGHFILAAVLMFLAMILFLFVVGPILDDLESVNRKTPDERLQRVAQKIDRLRKEIRNQAMIQILMSGIFGYWPYAQRFSSYELPIA